MTETYEYYPASYLFPMMDEFDLNRLAKSIKALGLQEPIVLYRGQVLDGRNRLMACS